MNTFLVPLIFLRTDFSQECVPSSVLERKSQRKLCLNVHTETLILLIKGGSFLRENSDGYGDGRHLNLAQCYLCICAILKSDSFGKLNALLFAFSAFICCSSFPGIFSPMFGNTEVAWWAGAGISVPVSPRTAAHHPKQDWFWSGWGWCLWVGLGWLQVWDKRVAGGVPETLVRGNEL